MAPEPASDELPSSELAASAASMALRSPAVEVHRFTTGSAHFVFEVTCAGGQKIVARAGPEANRAALIGSARLTTARVRAARNHHIAFWSLNTISSTVPLTVALHSLSKMISTRPGRSSLTIRTS